MTTTDVEMAEATSQIDLNGSSQRPSVTVTKPIPYTFDLGHLLCIDANPLPPQPSNADLNSTARDCAQSLLNQLLSTCPIKSTPEGVHIDLPPPTTPLPREKPVPKAKEPTKWEKFAAKKGINGKRRDGKMVYDEAKGDWVPKYGYKGRNKDGEEDWLVEVDEKKEAERGQAGDARREKRQERVERIRRQERKQRANERRTGKGGGGG
jgi:regulator of ribosome biosynthesis